MYYQGEILLRSRWAVGKGQRDCERCRAEDVAIGLLWEQREAARSRGRSDTSKEGAQTNIEILPITKAVSNI